MVADSGGGILRFPDFSTGLVIQLDCEMWYNKSYKVHKVESYKVVFDFWYLTFIPRGSLWDLIFVI